MYMQTPGRRIREEAKAQLEPNRRQKPSKRSSASTAGDELRYYSGRSFPSSDIFTHARPCKEEKRDRRRGPNLFIDLSIPAIASSFFFFFFFCSFFFFFFFAIELFDALNIWTLVYTRRRSVCACNVWWMGTLGGGGGSIADQAEEKRTKFA